MPNGSGHRIVVYEASGRMATQQANLADRKPFAKGPSAGTLEEKAAAFDSYGACYGTYTVDTKAGTIMHHIEDGLNPACGDVTTSSGSGSRVTIASF